MRVVFFGTPEFAVPSLRALLQAGHEVAAVVTQPDRAQGRSRSVLVPPPVKEYALAQGLEVLQPERPVGDVFLEHLRRLRPEVGVVVAYGHLLRPAVLAVPPRGMLNVHASLLPRHRGAAPIQWAILEGDAETGVSIMRLDEGMDTGDVLETASTPITDDDTAATLAARLAELGAATLVRALARVERGDDAWVPQDHARATHAPKIDRALARIRWEEPAARVARRVQAFDPAPGAWTQLDGADVKLFGAHAAAGAGAPGTILGADDALLVACGSGAVRIAEVQPAGRKRMPVTEWRRGHPDAAGRRFA